MYGIFGSFEAFECWCRSDSNQGSAPAVMVTPQFLVPNLKAQTLKYGIGNRVLDCNSGKCGTNVKTTLWDAGTADGQKWSYDPIKKTLTSGGYCLDVANGGKDNKTVVRSWDCNNSPAQQWSWQKYAGPGKGAYQLQNVNSGKCLDIQGAADANGQATQLWDCQSHGNGWNV